MTKRDDQYRIPVMIFIESPEIISTDRILAILEIAGVKTDPASIMVIEEWGRISPDAMSGTYEIDVIGVESVMPILQGNRIEITRGAVTIEQAPYY